MSERKSITMDNLSYKGMFLRAWEFLGFDMYRIYFRPYQCETICGKDCEGGHGFDFAVVEWVSSSGDDDRWQNDTEVQFLFNGIAYFDGIRHMWLGTEQDEIFGYVNYPNLEELIEILQEIRKLELKYCRNY